MSLARIYDDFAADYDKSRGLFDMGDVLADFTRRLPASGRLLELGCGAGEPFARHFIDRGWSVTGVDFSAGFLALAARYVPEMTRVQADMREAQFEPATFEAVCAVYSLFHVPRSSHAPLFSRIRDWLVPGGTVLFTYATRAYTGVDRFEGVMSFMGRDLFYSHGTPADMVGDLVAGGLELVEARERAIGGETFLWVTAARPVGDG